MEGLFVLLLWLLLLMKVSPLVQGCRETVVMLVVVVVVVAVMTMMMMIRERGGGIRRPIMLLIQMRIEVIERCRCCLGDCTSGGR